MQINEILTKFENVKQMKPNSYQCKCPAHDDRKASLTITQGNNKILLHCHAGCKVNDILSKINLKMSDMYDNENNNKKTLSWQKRLELYKNKEIEATYTYTDKNNKYLYTKVRFKGKEITYGILNKEKDMLVLNLNNTSKQLYNLPNFLKAVQNGETVYFVEGEKDVETLRRFNMTATTCGGVGDWKEEFAEYFKGAKTIILPDNDKVGIKLAEQVKNDIKKYAFQVKTVIVSSSDKGDVTDYLTTEKHNINELKILVEQTEWSYAPYVYFNSNGNIKFNADLLSDFVLNSSIQMSLYKKNVDNELLYIFENGVYTESSKSKLKSLIKEYIPKGLATDYLLNNTFNLMICENKNKHDFNAINTNETYINVKNGLYNLKTKILEPHNSKVLSTLQLNCNHISENVKTKEPIKWLKFIDELCTNQDGQVDESIKKVLQEFGGLLLSNYMVAITKKCLILYSPLGNTGKSVFLNVINKLTGEDNIINIPMQKLSDRFAIGNVYGKRLISIGDQSAEDIIDSSIFKQLTGGDPVAAEMKGKQSFNFTFQGGIMVACNNLPCFTDDKGGHIFERLLVIPCTNVIPEKKRNKKLIYELLEEKDGIFMWFLEGLHRLIDNDFEFTESKAIDEAINEYRNNIDTLYHYISENCEITENKMDRIKKTEFEARYTAWCADNEYKAIFKKNIKERAAKIGITLTKWHGDWYYQYIKYKTFKLIENVKKEEQKEMNNLFK